MTRKTADWIRLAIVFGIWSIVQAALLTTDLPWLFRLSPAIMTALALIVSSLAIWQTRNRVKVECAMIDGKTINCCLLCKHCIQKPNPWSQSFPINDCKEKNATVYDPMHITGWCPHAVR